MWRFLTANDLQTYKEKVKTVNDKNLPIVVDGGPGVRSSARDANKVIDFLHYITRLGLPEGFLLVNAYPEDDECKNVHGMAFTAGIPTVRFHTLVIQNVSETPLDINAFRLAEMKSMRLRLPSETISELAKLTESELALFQQKKLLSQEALIFPLNMYIGQLDEDRNQCIEEKTDINATSPAAEKVYLGEHSDNAEQAFWVKANSIPPASACPKPVTYDYGPALRLKSVDINGIWYPIRSFDSRLVNLLASFEGGSCPHLFVYKSDTDEYVNKGEILIGANNIIKTKKERIDVTGATKYLRISELDDETSFIDYAAIIRIDSSGIEHTVYALDQRLAMSDGNYVVLRKGEEIDLQFAEVSEGGREFLEVEGYFVRNGTEDNGLLPTRQ